MTLSRWRCFSGILGLQPRILQAPKMASFRPWQDFFYLADLRKSSFRKHESRLSDMREIILPAHTLSETSLEAPYRSSLMGPCRSLLRICASQFASMDSI